MRLNRNLPPLLAPYCSLISLSYWRWLDRKLAVLRQHQVVMPACLHRRLVYDEAFEIASDGSSGGSDLEDWLSEDKVRSQALCVLLCKPLA